MFEGGRGVFYNIRFLLERGDPPLPPTLLVYCEDEPILLFYIVSSAKHAVKYTLKVWKKYLQKPHTTSDVSIVLFSSTKLIVMLFNCFRLKAFAKGI